MNKPKIIQIVNTIIIVSLILPVLNFVGSFTRMLFAGLLPAFNWNFKTIFIFGAIPLLYLYFIIRAYKACNLDNKYFKITLVINLLILLAALSILFSFVAIDAVYAVAALFAMSFIVYTIGYFKNKKLT
jgi:hypothetical protein